MNEVKKVILFLLCCAIPFSFYAQKARQNAVTKKWGYEQTENKRKKYQTREQRIQK